MAQNPRELERVRYWQGQLLASDDLNTQLRVDEELRRLHNRSLHQPYGIAIGLELERDETTKEIKVDEDDIARFAKLYRMNGRTVQSRDRRFILSSGPR